VDFDLSQVMLHHHRERSDTIPGPLRDRMEIIALPGYHERRRSERSPSVLG